MRAWEQDPVLTIEHLTMRFGGLLAIDDVSFAVERQDITALIGPNGAGKTSVLNCICGIYRPTSGRITFGDTDITRARPHHIARLGIARTFQKLEVFSSLTVWENVLVAVEIHGGFAVGKGDGPMRNSGGGDHEQAVAAVIERVRLSDVAGDRVDSLPTGQCRRPDRTHYLSEDSSRPTVRLNSSASAPVKRSSKILTS